MNLLDAGRKGTLNRPVESLIIKWKRIIRAVELLGENRDYSGSGRCTVERTKENVEFLGNEEICWLIVIGRVEDISLSYL